MTRRCLSIGAFSRYFFLLWTFLWCRLVAPAFVPLAQHRSSFKQPTSFSLFMEMDPTLASLIAGSVAGSIGVGVAFPLDTVKTKAQVLTQQVAQQGALDEGTYNVNANMFDLFKLIYHREGLNGFFGGVWGMMVGQSPIYATVFASKTAAIQTLNEYAEYLPSIVTLTLAACYAGFIATFVVVPVERVKVLMQTSSEYKNEWECVQAILNSEGLTGLFRRGLGITLLREVPGYGIYFVVYDVMMQTWGSSLGVVAPLVFGAIAGMLSWVPVYPFDVVKTTIQNTSGEDTQTTWEISKQIYQTSGIGGFFDGLTPKMLRASVSNATIFFVYGFILEQWGYMPEY